MAFRSDRSHSKEIDTSTSETNAVLQELYLSDTPTSETNAALQELYRSVATKTKLSNIAKLSAFKSVCVPILTCGHESW